MQNNKLPSVVVIAIRRKQRPKGKEDFQCTFRHFKDNWLIKFVDDVPKFQVPKSFHCLLFQIAILTCPVNSLAFGVLLSNPAIAPDEEKKFPLF